MVYDVSRVSSMTIQTKSPDEIELFAQARKKGLWLVSAGETFSAIAQQFGIDNYKTLMSLINKSESQTALGKGDELTGFKTVKCKQGQGLASLASNAGMSLDAFCKLNRISKTYIPQPGEMFFRAFTKEEIQKVTSSATPATATATKSTNANETQAVTTSKQSSDRNKGQYTVVDGDTVSKIASRFNMSVETFMEKTGLKSTKIEAGQIITKLPTLTVQSGKGWSWVMQNSNGMTKSQIMELNGLPKNYEFKAGEKIYIYGTPASASASGSSSSDDSTISKCTVPDCGYITAKAGDKVSNGKKPAKFYDEDGNMVAEAIKFSPTNSKGDLKGKTIMINAGHGWGKKGVFDPGTFAVDSNGKTIYEWYKNRNFSDELIKELTSRGATVIFTSGKANLTCAAKKDIPHDMFISIHCNGVASRKPEGLQVYYYDTTDYQLANLVAGKFRNYDNCAVKHDSESQHDEGIGVLRTSSSKPSILVEMGFQSNPDDLKNIDSIKFRRDTMKSLADSIEAYWGL